MITKDTEVPIYKKSQDAFLNYLKSVRDTQRSVNNLREYFRRIDLAYQREQDFTSENIKATLHNEYGDPTKFRNVTVPVVSAQVESSVVYQASVFLTGSPLFGVVANPVDMDAAMQMESLIDDQAIRGSWVNEFIKVFRDAAKYNFWALEVDWESHYMPSLETDLKFSAKEARPKQLLWEGNVVRRIDPYNTIRDPRVAPSELSTKGEFVGYSRIMNRMELRKYILNLSNRVRNDTKAFEAPLLSQFSTDINAAHYIPQVNSRVMNSDLLMNTEFNWSRWFSDAPQSSDYIQYRETYILTTLYCRILPVEFQLNVPEKNTPQIWKLIFVNESVLIYAERQTNAHDKLPILCGQWLDDGLSYQTKSLASNVVPFQHLNSAVWNGAIAGIRKSILDRIIYNPQAISTAHMNDDNPVSRIPLRSAAYGRSIQEVISTVPYNLNGLGDMMALTDRLDRLADKSSNQNPVRQGQFVRGNKTRKEFDTVMQNASGLDQLIAMQFEGSLFSPLKEILKLNNLQYAMPATVLSRSSKQVINIDPVKMRKAVMSFKVSDGLLPSEKIISLEALREGFQTLANIQAIQAGYNLTPMFSYLMKLQGAELEAFEKPPEQQAYEQALSAWQNTIVQLVKANPAIQPNQYPPQPKPQDFGYNPNITNQPQEDNDDTTQQPAAGTSAEETSASIASLFSPR